MATPTSYAGSSYYEKIRKNQGALTPDDLTYFEGQKRRTKQQYGMGLAENAFRRKTTKATGALSRSDLVRQFDAMRRKIPEQFAAGGTLNSGLYQKGIADYATQRSGALAMHDTDLQSQLDALGISDAQLEAMFKSSMDDIRSAEAARRATAEALRIAQGGF